MKFVVVALLVLSFALAGIALFLSLAIPRYVLSADVSQLSSQMVQILPDNNVTVSTTILNQLVTCRTYVQTHVPNTTGLVPFNGTLLVQNATLALNALIVSLQSTGIVTTVNSGNVTINGYINMTYEKRYQTLGNATFYYVHIPANPTLRTITVNNTNMLSFDGWTSVVYPGGGAYNATEPIFDEQRTKIQTAPLPATFQSKSYSYTAIILGNLVNLLNASYVLEVMRDLQL